MVQVKTYQLPPTSLIPNSPRPILHYPGFFPVSSTAAAQAYDILSENGWQAQWIYRYGSTQASHYHSNAHECMVVLSGSATIQFGAADQEDRGDGSTGATNGGHEEDGVKVQAHVGDVFVIPAGVAHKTFDTSPSLPFALLTPRNGPDVSAHDQRQAIADTPLSGFTMMGAYPKEGGAWDFCTGGGHVGDYEKVWAVVKPERDPVLGQAEEGLVGRWSE
ncbi:hypothetical protein BGW36DRAFT_286986 [Talaromyces proteolyticus]|uniref:Cupin type-1 domain-containing protein n=1 Tax=Talaromyces proteolyticus TaxID=1131652 RepID=A0AAD4L2Q6_9EURO|nr:uncharacterized protein BGW36DRAFT_286986 [Talaromyces proteolyticus]KAH8703494.1 hypothetical protein BGW36DRAFT_286986 [Talaromyces proteolyticus]